MPPDGDTYASRIREISNIESQRNMEHTIGPIYNKTWKRFRIFKLELEVQNGRRVSNDEALSYLLDLYEGLNSLQPLMEADKK